MPHYDFNWQHWYQFESPLALDNIDALEMEVRFDNSTENPTNPEPEEYVTWGDQTWQEMAVAFFDIAHPRDNRGSSRGRRRPTKWPTRCSATERIRRDVDTFLSQLDETRTVSSSAKKRPKPFDDSDSGRSTTIATAAWNGARSKPKQPNELGRLSSPHANNLRKPSVERAEPASLLLVGGPRAGAGRGACLLTALAIIGHVHPSLVRDLFVRRAETSEVTSAIDRNAPDVPRDERPDVEPFQVAGGECIVVATSEDFFTEENLQAIRGVVAISSDCRRSPTSCGWTASRA